MLLEGKVYLLLGFAVGVHFPIELDKLVLKLCLIQI